MQLPDLRALQQGDAAAWDMAFPWLWPAAFGAAQVTLQPYLPAEVEDVAIESLEALVEKVRELKSVEELKPLVAVIQVAMLDTAGVTRGSDTNEISLLRQAWELAAVDSFGGVEALHAWETNWPAQDKRPVVKVVFDRAAGEVRILGHWKGESFTNTFLVERDLATTLEQAKSFIKQRTSQ
jgi:hypothetical protein